MLKRLEYLLEFDQVDVIYDLFAFAVVHSVFEPAFVIASVVRVLDYPFAELVFLFELADTHHLLSEFDLFSIAFDLTTDKVTTDKLLRFDTLLLYIQKVTVQR